MGAHTAFPLRYLQSRGSQIERLCCGAAPARSPVTTYVEAGARTAHSKDPSRRLHQEPLARPASSRASRRCEAAPAVLDSSPADLLDAHEPSTAAAPFSRGSTGGPHVLTPAVELSPPSVHTGCLTTPVASLSAEAHFLLTAPGQQQRPGVLQEPLKPLQHDLFPPAHLQQQDLQQRQHATLPWSTPALPPGRGSSAQERHTLRPQELLPVEEADAVIQQHQHQRVQIAAASNAGCARSQDEGPPPYLDAASRTAGVASTSDRQRLELAGSRGDEGGGVLAAARRRGPASGRRRGPRGGEKRVGSASDVPSDAYSSSGATVRPAIAVAVDVEAASGSRAAVGVRLESAAAAAAAAAVAAAAMTTVGAADGKAIDSPGYAAGGPRISDDSTCSRHDALPAGGGGVSAPSVPVSPAPVVVAATAARTSPAQHGGGTIAAGAAKPRRPRAPSAAEHRALRLRARLQQVALLPREPTEDDLRLTADVTRATHWRDLISLLAEHRERLSRRNLQEQLEPFLQRSAKLQQSRRRRSVKPPAAQPSAATAALTAAAAAAATAADAPLSGNGGSQAGLDLGVLPVSALPLTPQHVAAALLRTWQLLASVSGPRTLAEARTLHSMVDWLARLAARLAPSPGTSLRELATVMYALVRLRHPLSKRYFLVLMNEALRRFSTTHRRRQRGAGGGGAGTAPMPYNAQDMAQLLWAVANCGLQSLRADWAAAYCGAVLPVVSELTPQGVGMVLHSLARLRCTPPPELLAALCSRLVAAMGCDGAGGGGDSDGLLASPPLPAADATASAVNGGWRAGCAPPQPAPAATTWCNGSPHLQPAIGHSLGGIYSAAPPGEAHPGASPLRSSAPAAAPPPVPANGCCSCLPSDVSMSLWALATLRLSPASCCPGLLPAVERYSLPRLAEFPEQELSNLVWALARLQYVPGRQWAVHLYDAIWRQVPELRPQALSTLLYGIAQMGQRPDPEWVDALLPYVRARLRWFPPQSLSLTIHALAALGCRPSDAWLGDFHAQLDSYRGQLDMRVRNKVREAYKIMGFRPGGPAALLAAPAPAPAPDQRPQLEVGEEEECEGMGRSRHGAVRGPGVAARHPSRNAQERGAGEGSPSRGRRGHDAVPDPQAAARQGKQERDQAAERGEVEEGRRGAVGEEQQLRRQRREGTAGEGGDRVREGGGAAGAAAASDDGGGQVLVRPSRFVF